jgi:DNA-binding response OmpR family regulator
MLLEELVRNDHSLVTREHLGMLLGVSRGVGSDHVINTHLSRLRIKLSDAGLRDVITTVRGIGFRLVSQSSGQ